MAKINHILFGQAKGKVGGMVLQRYEGMNIAREKPISVKNPQSTKQTEQRAKFKMASQILAEYKEAITLRLSNLSIYERTRRANGVNAIIGVISTTNPDTPSTLVADVVSAINSKNPSGVNVIVTNDTNNDFELTVDNDYTCTYAMCDYDANGKMTSKSVETFVSNGSQKHIPYGTGSTHVLMAVAYKALTESGRATIANVIANPSGTGWQNAIARSVKSGDIEISNLASITHHA